MNPMGYVKEHPYLVGGAAIVIIGGAFLLFGGSSGSDETGPMSVNLAGPSDASIQAGMQVQALKAEGDAHTAEVNAAKETTLASVAADLKKAEYAQQTSFHVADITGQVSQADIASKNYASTLAYTTAQTAMRLSRQQHEKDAARSFTLAKLKLAADKRKALKKVTKH